MTSFTEKLIEVVKLHKILFDTSHPDYKHTKKKDRTWEKIGRSLDSSGEDIKKKWKNIRDSYAKHIRAENNTDKTRLQTKSTHRYRTWPWAGQMAFFRPYLQLSRTEFPLPNSNVPPESHVYPERNQVDKTQDHNVPSEITNTKSQSLSSTTFRKRKKCEDTTVESPATCQLLPYLENKNVDANDSYDDIDLLCLGYAKTIKKFSPRRQTMVKFKIAQIMMQEELAHQMGDVDGSQQSLQNTVTTK